MEIQKWQILKYLYLYSLSLQIQIKEFKPENFKIKSKLLKLIFKEYNITLNDLKNNKEVYSTMKSSGNGMYITRDIHNILLPYKQPIAYNYEE